MDNSRLLNNTKPDEVVLQHALESLEAAIRERLLDTTQPGVRAGLRVSINNADRTRIDISPGWGYTPNGERIWLRSALTGISLTQRTDQAIPTATWRVPIQANGTYAAGTQNYVVLRYVTHKEHPAIRRDDSISLEYLIRKGRFEVEILTQADYLALAKSDEWDSSAVSDLGDGTFGLPTLPPFASAQFRLLLATVTARGPGNAILATDVLSSDPGVSQPSFLTGVRTIAVSPNTPTGTGMLRWVAGTRTLSWQAPTDPLAGLAITVGPDDALLHLESGSSVEGSLTLEVEITANSLPNVDVEDPIGLVPRLEQVFPQALQPRLVTGCVSKWVTSNTQLGTGRLAYAVSGQTLSWQAPADSAAGVAVDVSAGGEFSLASGTSSYVLRVFVSETGLPDTDVIEDVRVRGLYEQDFPMLTAIDAHHRSMTGAGVSIPTNPHATTYTDIALASGQDLFQIHQGLFHANGIAFDANPAYLSVSVQNNTLAIATLDDNLLNRFLVQGRIYTSPRNFPVVDFSPGGVAVPRGYYLVFIDPDGILTRLQVCEIPSLTGIAITPEIPDEPAVRIIDVRRSTSSGTFGRLVYDVLARTFQWRGPGNTSFGAPVAAGPDIRITDGQGDWIRLAVHRERLITTGSTVTLDIRFAANAEALDDSRQMRIAMVAWDDVNERFAYIQDLRRFATSDVSARLERILDDLRSSNDGAPSLEERLMRDQRERHDNSITTRYPHGSLLDDDASCYQVVQHDFLGKIRLIQPTSSYSHFWVRGRRHRYVLGKLDLTNAIPLTPPGEEPVNTTDVIWDFVEEDSDNVPNPSPDATLFQVYLDEFGRMGVHARVTMAEDSATKPVSSFVISNISETFPVGPAILRCTAGFPSGAGIGISIGIGSTYGPIVPVERDGRTVRLYTLDGVDWVDVTQQFNTVLPGGNTSETFTVDYPVSPDDKLELARVAYDGSAEIIRVVDVRRFGSIGARSIGEDAFSSTQRTIRDGLQAETHASGVVSGLACAFVGNRLDWTAGVVVVDGRRLAIPAGTYTNTLTGTRRLYLFVEADGTVNISAGAAYVHAHRAGTLVAVIYIEDSGDGIQYVEDRRRPPSPSPRVDSQRRMLTTSFVDHISLTDGIAPSSPYSLPDDPNSLDTHNYTAISTLNVNMTSDSQGTNFWLEDEQKDGLVMMMIQKMDQTVIPGGVTDIPVAASAQFAFFKVPAGNGPKTRADLVYLGSPSIPMLVQQGGVNVFPARKVIVGANLRLTSPSTGVALIDGTATSGGGGGGGGGSDYLPLIWSHTIEAEGTVIGAGAVAWGEVLKISIPVSGGDLAVWYSSVAITGAATASQTPSPGSDNYPDVFIAVRSSSAGAPDPDQNPRTYCITDPSTNQDCHRDLQPNSYTHFTMMGKVQSIGAGQFRIYAGAQGGLHQSIRVADSLQVMAIWSPSHATEL